MPAEVDSAVWGDVLAHHRGLRDFLWTFDRVEWSTVMKNLAVVGLQSVVLRYRNQLQDLDLPALQYIAKFVDRNEGFPTTLTQAGKTASTGSAVGSKSGGGRLLVGGRSGSLSARSFYDDSTISRRSRRATPKKKASARPLLSARPVLGGETKRKPKATRPFGAASVWNTFGPPSRVKTRSGLSSTFTPMSMTTTVGRPPRPPNPATAAASSSTATRARRAPLSARVVPGGRGHPRSCGRGAAAASTDQSWMNAAYTATYLDALATARGKLSPATGAGTSLKLNHPFSQLDADSGSSSSGAAAPAGSRAGGRIATAGHRGGAHGAVGSQAAAFGFDPPQRPRTAPSGDRRRGPHEPFRLKDFALQPIATVMSEVESNLQALDGVEAGLGSSSAETDTETMADKLQTVIKKAEKDGLSPRSRQRPRPHAFTDEEDIGFGMDALQDVTLRTQLSPRPASSRPSSAKRLRDVMFSEDSAKELPLDLLPGRRERRTRHIAAQSHDAAHQRVRGARAFTYHVS